MSKTQLLLIEVELEDGDTFIVPEEFKNAVYESLAPDVLEVKVMEIVDSIPKHYLLHMMRA